MREDSAVMAGDVQAGRPLRVLYSFPHPLGDAGIGTTAYHQVLGLAERGAVVTVWCTSIARRLPPDVSVVETMTRWGRRIPHRVVGVDRTYRYHDRQVARLLERNSPGFDIVHTWPLGAASTLAAARGSGVPAVRESPNSYTAVAYERSDAEAQRLGVDMPRGQSHRFDRRRLEREELEYDLATAVLVPSTFVEQSFERRPGPPVRTLRHQYGFDPERFPVPTESRPDRPFTLVFLGHGEPRKGLHFALEAWHEAAVAATGARFVICGEMMPGYRSALSGWLDDESIIEMPFTSDAGGLLRGADALILPSVEEGSALVTYEAQASGCALLVSDSTGALLVDGEHGFVHHAGDVTELTEQLHLLATDRPLLARMRRNVLAHRHELTWAAAARRLEGVYEGLIAG
jgi:glycosyltransferase involved in cell wall biosynthesis